jgi:mono/diheme cytochrome c family protein
MRSPVRFLFLLIAILFVGVTIARAQRFQAPAADDITSGAQLYDKWYAALGKEAPAGNMPIWERQSTNTRSGADTWRCAECHGWDYKGSEGAYSAGSHFTGFPNVMELAAGMSKDEIVAHLKGSKDPSHDFSTSMDDASLQKLAAFLKDGLIDDAQYIDTVSLKVKSADAAHGKQLYDTTCAKCHGADGKQIVFRTEGINESLGAVADRDPYRFLHRTRFGVAGTEMPIGRTLGWAPKDGVDVLAYAQTLPTGAEQEEAANAGEASEAPEKVGGPVPGVLGGIFTGLLAFFGMLGLSAVFLFGLVVFGFLVIWALRKRK